jgi:hypothetical protein
MRVILYHRGRDIFTTNLLSEFHIIPKTIRDIAASALTINLLTPAGYLAFIVIGKIKSIFPGMHFA